MAYAGIQTLLLTYKMQKADKEFHLSKVSDEYFKTLKESDACNTQLQKEKNKLMEEYEDDPEGYTEALEDLDDYYEENILAEMAAKEELLQQEISNDNTQIKQLDGYINSWTTALQSSIAKTHTYGQLDQ